jgi:hypothetical protein
VSTTTEKRLPIVESGPEWQRMLGAPTRPGDPERPPAPLALGLNKLVKAHALLTKGTPRAHGFHPSELPKLCPTLYYFEEKAREDLCSDDPEKITAAFKFIQDCVNAKRQQFSPEVQLEFRVGDSIHSEVQWRLGVLGYLWGRWKCVHCHAVTDPGWMPRMWVDDVNGQPILDAAPCVQCNGLNRRDKVPWVYLEPKVENAEWGVTGHCDGDLRVPSNGYWYRYILEVKSINSAGFEGKRGPLPQPDHVIQASIYGWLLGVDHIVFVYVCKDQVSKWKEFVVPVDRVAIADAQNRIAAVLKARETGEPPLKARACPDVQDERAKACPAVEKCFGKKPLANFWDP